MVTNVQRAALVSRHVELVSVTLQSATLESKVDPQTPPPELRIGQRYRAHYSLEEGSICVLVEFEFEAEDPEQEDAEVLSLEAGFRLIYELKNAADYPSDALEHFASLNGPYNAWPYWRELVQTVSGRTGLAGIVVPVHRPAVRPLTEDEREQLELPEPEAG